MTTEEKIEAVEAFLEWRENAHPTDTPESLVEKWRTVLNEAADAAVLADIRKEAQFVQGNPDEALKLVERIASGY